MCLRKSLTRAYLGMSGLQHQIQWYKNSRSLQSQRKHTTSCSMELIRPKRPKHSPSPSTSNPISPTATPKSTINPNQGRSATLAVIGDVHDQWSETDVAALHSLNADVAVFVGDFGNENVELITSISQIDMPKVVILGNHDAWYSLTPRGRNRAVRVALQSSTLKSLKPGAPTNAVEAQLTALGNQHVGYAAQNFPNIGISFFGGRPFSKGGKRWDDIEAFYKQHYDIHSLEESAHRILDVALSTADQYQDSALVVVSHNGPTGLGDRRWDPCGVDWQEPEEDFGDPDLKEALDMAHNQGVTPTLCIFGHMHHALKPGGKRNMAAIDPKTGTVYLNAAVVPRVKKINGVKAHHFMLVDIKDGRPWAARHVWTGLVDSGEHAILSEEELLKTTVAGDGSNRLVQSYYKAHRDEWESVVIETTAAVTSRV